MAHDISIHKEYYRLPEDTLQLAKCSKILMLMDAGECKHFIGKTLDQIEVDLNGNPK